MKETILVGRGQQMYKVDADHWHRHLEHIRHTPSMHLGFMTSDHHRVRNFVVRELPRNAGNPLSAQVISIRLGLPLSRVLVILDDLQQHLLFLVQEPAGEACWAYPVTAEKTPHRLTFSTGETIFAA